MVVRGGRVCHELCAVDGRGRRARAPPGRERSLEPYAQGLGVTGQRNMDDVSSFIRP